MCALNLHRALDYESEAFVVHVTMSKANINVWWDLESIKFDKGFDPLRSYGAIISFLIGFSDEIKSIKAYVVVGCFNDTIIDRLAKCGVVEFVPVPVPHEIKELQGSQLVDLNIDGDSRLWADMCKPPNVVVLISCNVRYFENLKALKCAGYEICVIYATRISGVSRLI